MDDTSEPSIVEYFAEQERYRCGYCRSYNTNYSHGMWAHQMTVQDYQDLIDRGWRRSGKYCYKPTMSMTCCPQYTIRCDATAFKLNKSHKKAIKRVNKFLITGVRPGQSSAGEGEPAEEDPSAEGGGGGSKGVEAALAEKAKPSQIELPSDVKKKKTDAHGAESKEDVSKDKSASLTPPLSSSSNTKQDVQVLQQQESQKHIPKPGSGADPNKPACRKAKELRAERRLKKQQANGAAEMSQKRPRENLEKSLEDFLSEPEKASNPVHKLELRLVRSAPRSDQFSATFSAAHNIYHKYQMVIHKDPPEKPNVKQYTRFLCDSPLVIKLYRSAPECVEFRVSFPESYSVYRKYQMTIHKEKPADCERSGFKDFLVNSPLEESHDEGCPPDGYGSFHQQYLLDGKIIAVGVIDILPSCVSSVYLYYDPDYSFLGLGVYSALREIAFVRELSQHTPALHYYYMGFYIHSCPKMRYKGQYVPSFISCPEAYTWVPIEKCRPKLDASNYARLEDEGVDDKEKNIDVDQVLCLYKGTMLPYVFYRQMKPKTRDQEEVLEYAGLVGKTCAQRMLLVRK